MLVLEQTHRQYGKVVTYVSPTAVKVINSVSDRVFLCAAPKFDAVFYADKRKWYSKTPFASWSKLGLRTALSIESNEGYINWPMVFEKKITYAGLPAMQYAFPLKNSDGKPAPLSFGKVGEYKVTRDVRVHNNVLRFLQAMFDMPTADGLPLQFCRMGTDAYGFRLKYNLRERVLDVFSTSKTKVVPVKPGFFDQPRNYKLVHENEILVPKDDATGAYAELMH